MNADIRCVNTIRLMCADVVQKAKSGHPGIGMGAAPAAYALWGKAMSYNPANPSFRNRDRFILSAGHGSALLYTLLHLFGFDVSIEDLKNFRQWGSATPGHPEYGHTPGVEVTTGPLGQGIANAVGMAWAEAYLAAHFNKPQYPVVDHFTFALCGDGCLMEGISSEAASLAGTLGLGKLVLLYDSNNITIEGDTNITFRENVAKRFEALDWHVQVVNDGSDVDAILSAIQAAKVVTDKPSIIEIKTQIGFGSPNKQGKSSAHGEPLGEDELKLTKEALGFSPNEHFYVPPEVKAHLADLIKEMAAHEEKWNTMLSAYAKAYPDLYAQWNAWHDNNPQVDLLNNEDFWKYDNSNMATRASSEAVLNKVSKLMPNLIGGSADLAPSTKTVMKDRQSYSKDNPTGSNLHFGVREHAMTAIANGMALHGGLRPYIAGFFVFCDYMKPAMRLSALMNLPVINILTHDSIGVGEDGPTHQPIEQLASLRAIPNFTVIRPCDTNETAAAWYLALTRTTSPTALTLSRQNLPLLKETGKGALKGGYILRDSEKVDVILIASGSEVELIYKAYDILKTKGIGARVVSMPSMEIFEEQPSDYKESVLPKNIKARLAVEAASSFGWHKYVGLEGTIIAIDTFGASAPAGTLFEKYGFTVDNIVEKAQTLTK